MQAAALPLHRSATSTCKATSRRPQRHGHACVGPGPTTPHPETHTQQQQHTCTDLLQYLGKLVVENHQLSQDHLEDSCSVLKTPPTQHRTEVHRAMSTQLLACYDRLKTYTPSKAAERDQGQTSKHRAQPKIDNCGGPSRFKHTSKLVNDRITLASIFSTDCFQSCLKLRVNCSRRAATRTVAQTHAPHRLRTVQPASIQGISRLSALFDSTSCKRQQQPMCCYMPRKVNLEEHGRDGIHYK